MGIGPSPHPEAELQQFPACPALPAPKIEHQPGNPFRE